MSERASEQANRPRSEAGTRRTRSWRSPLCFAASGISAIGWGWGRRKRNPFLDPRRWSADIPRRRHCHRHRRRCCRHRRRCCRRRMPLSPQPPFPPPRAESAVSRRTSRRARRTSEYRPPPVISSRRTAQPRNLSPS